MQVQNCQKNNPASIQHEVKWRAQANTRESISSNQVSIYRKSCCEYKHTPTGNKASSKADVDKTRYTSSNHSFLRLVCRGDNPNKETLIDIP